MFSGSEYLSFCSVGDYNIANKSLEKQNHGILEGALWHELISKTAVPYMSSSHQVLLFISEFNAILCYRLVSRD